MKWRRILRWLHRRGVLVRHDGGGESRAIYRVCNRWAVKVWRWNRTPDYVREVCRRSRTHPDFEPQWYIPRLHWSVRRWVDGEAPTNALLNELLNRHTWATDWKDDCCRVTPAGVRVFDFEIR